jgi:hypothetical protein
MFNRHNRLVLYIEKMQNTAILLRRFCHFADTCTENARLGASIGEMRGTCTEMGVFGASVGCCGDGPTRGGGTVPAQMPAEGPGRSNQR